MAHRAAPVSPASEASAASVVSWLRKGAALQSRPAARRHRRRTAALCVSLIGLVGAGWLGGSQPERADAAQATPSAPTAKASWAGRVLTTVSARRAPDANAKVITRVRPIAPLGGGEAVLAITRVATDAQGRPWVEVKLPIRPIGTRGWLPADMLQMRKLETRISISTSARTLTLFRAGKPILRTKVAVGKPGTPTPIGDFAVAEELPTGESNGVLGPMVLPLTAYSPTLNEFAGGNGRVAMHGTNAPGLIGTRASHGCIRIPNATVLRLSKLVGPGTPVKIT